MQYHALSLLQNNMHVHLMGYAGSPLIAPLANWSKTKNATTLTVDRFAPRNFKLPSIVRLPLRLISITFFLFKALFTSPKFDAIILQNPPVIPSLAIVLFFTKFIRFTPSVIVDWHNLGFTMFADSKGVVSTLIKTMAYFYELLLTPRADGAFYVTRRMKDFVCDKFNGSGGAVLYDCPPRSMFSPAKSIAERDKLRKSMFSTVLANIPNKWNSAESLYASASSSPLLLVSSTSWTPDEDFSILLDALIIVQANLIQLNDNTTKIQLLVTGKGPQKQMYEERIAKMNLPNISIQTVWLETEDYPKLLSVADCGVCLHTSTSGIDLPMKVVDMYDNERAKRENENEDRSNERRK